MNYAVLAHGQPDEVIQILDDDIDTHGLALAMTNAFRRIALLESQADQRCKALVGLLDVFHEGQVIVREAAAGYVESVIEAGEAALKP